MSRCWPNQLPLFPPARPSPIGRCHHPGNAHLMRPRFLDEPLVTPDEWVIIQATENCEYAHE